MVLLDARSLPQDAVIEADICIVGAGAAGIAMARELAGEPLRVVLLESGGLDQPSLFSAPDGWAPNLRRVLVDLIDEYCRHTGHADLFREQVDGLVGEDPPQD